MSEKSTLQLPEDMPQCWNDEARMNVLFAPVRNRTVNPQDWDSKLSFWKNMIFQCCFSSKTFSVKLEDLQRVFTVNGRSPACLSTVFEEMCKTGDLQLVEQFLQPPVDSWTKWATNVFIKKPMRWSYSKLLNTWSTSSTASHTYVHLVAVQKEAENLSSLLPSDRINKVVSFQELLDMIYYKHYKYYVTKITDLKLVLHYLVCQGKADIKEIQSESDETPLDKILVKFGDIKTRIISDTDIGVYVLEQNEKTLTKNLEKLENDMQRITEDAKLYLQKGIRQMAKNCLRKKHVIENQINKKAATLHNVQSLLLKLKEADSDAQVLDSYKHALSTLKTNFKETGLSVDNVEDTVAELGELLDIQAEIQSTLAKPIVDDDDAELEDELAELMAAEDDSAPPKPPTPMKPEEKKTEDEETDELEQRLLNLRVPSSPVASSHKIAL